MIDEDGERENSGEMTMAELRRFQELAFIISFEARSKDFARFQPKEDSH